MGLTDKKEQQLRKMPQLEFRVYVSKDKKYVVHRTTITDIKPMAYYQKVVGPDSDVEMLALEELPNNP